jgi:hypothetical protein
VRAVVRRAAASAQDLERGAGTDERGALGIECSTTRRQRLDRDAVLARQVVQARESRVELLQAYRIDIEIIADALQRLRGFLDLDIGALEQGFDLAQARFVLGQAGQLGANAAHRTADCESLVARETRDGALAALDQGGGVRLAPVRREQRIDRIGFEGFAPELRALVFEPGQALADVALALEFGDAPLQCGGALRPFPHRVEQIAMAREGIEQAQLQRPLQQGLVLVLAVHLDQALAELTELRQGRRSPVDPGPRATIGAQVAAQLAVEPIVEFVLA